MKPNLPNITLLAGAVLIGVGVFSLTGLQFSRIDGHALIAGAILFAAGVLARK